MEALSSRRSDSCSSVGMGSERSSYLSSVSACRPLGAAALLRDCNPDFEDMTASVLDGGGGGGGGERGGEEKKGARRSCVSQGLGCCVCFGNRIRQIRRCCGLAEIIFVCPFRHDRVTMLCSSLPISASNISPRPEILERTVTNQHLILVTTLLHPITSAAASLDCFV